MRLLWRTLTFLILLISLESESQELREADCSECEHGICMDGICECEPCWKGVTCDTPENQPPKFSKKDFHFTLTPGSDDPPVVEIGTLNATDPDDISIPCGPMHFEIAKTSESTGVTINPSTGLLLLVNRTNLQLKQALNISVMVRNNEPFDAQFAEATVQIKSFDVQEGTAKHREENGLLKRQKRQTLNPPPEMQFEMIKVKNPDREEVCVGCYCEVKLVVRLPQGEVTPIVELFAPESEGATIEGYIDNLTLGKIGRLLPADLKMTQQTLKEDAGKAQHIAVSFSKIIVPSSGGFSVDDYAFEINYETKVKDTTKPGTNLTAGAGAQQGDVLWIGVMNLKITDPPAGKLTLYQCPSKSLYPGTVEEITFKVFAPFTDGNYSLEIVNPSGTLSILDVSVIPGDGFQDQPGTVKKTKRMSSSSSINQIDRFTVNIYGSQNKYALDVSKSEDQLGFKVAVIIQVSPFANSKGQVDVQIMFPNAVTLRSSCEFDISLDSSDFTKDPSPLVDVNMIDSRVDTLKTVDAMLQVTFPSNSKEAYYLDVNIPAPYRAEIGAISVESSGTGLPIFIKGLPLLTLYTRSGENNEILNATVYFGVIFNGQNTVNDYTVTVRVTIKALHPKEAKPGDEITITVTPRWSTGTGLAKSTSVSLGTVTTIEDPSQKMPTCSVDRIQPINGKPEARYQAIGQIKIILQEDFVYSPFSVIVNISGADGRLESANIQPFGNCIRDSVSAGILLNIESKFVSFQLDSVYAHCPTGETDLSIIMHVVISNKVAGTVPVICTLTVNGKQATNDNLIEFLAYTQPAELSADKKPTMNIKQANFGSSNFYNTGVNLILASLSILPVAKQNYNLRATAVPSDGSMLYCRPRMTSLSSLIGTIKEPQQVDRGTSVELPLGNLNYEITSAEMSASFDTLNYLIPVTITSVAGATASVTVVLTHGSTEVTTAVNPVLQAATSSGNKQNQYSIFSLETFDFNDRSRKEGPTVYGPGEVARFAYDVFLPESKCAEYSVVVSLTASGDWPVDLGGIYLQAYGNAIWCLDGWKTSTTGMSPGNQQPMTTLQLDLGVVCSQGTSDSWIRLGVFARPWMESPNANSQSHRTEVILNIRMNEGGSFDTNSIRTIIFTVDPTKSTVERLAPYAQSPTISFTTTVPAEGKPGEIKELNLLVSVPPASTLPESNVHIECPVQSGDAEAGCTVIGYSISSGFNLVGMANGRYTPTFSSTSPSNQLNKMNVPLGTVVNTGASQSLGLSIADVDLLSMTVQFRIADGKNSVNSAELPVNANVKLGSFNGDASSKLKVKRDGTEEMQIDLTSTVADVQSSYLPGDNVTLVVSMSMKITSRLECQSRSMLIHHSVFYENAKIIDQNSSAYQFTEDTSGTDSRVTKFTAGPLYFDQTVVVKLLLHVKDDLTFTDGESYKEATITTELICMAYERTSVAQRKLGGPPAVFFAFTPLKLTLPTSVICTSEVNMRNTIKILDCQISASSSPDPSYSVTMIRPNSGKGWRIPARSGAFAYQRYVTVLFGSTTELRFLDFTLLDPSNRVLKIAVYLTNDGRAYTLHEEGEINYSSKSDGTYRFKNVLHARGVRVVFKQLEYDSRTTVITMDFTVCNQAKDTNTFDPCSVVPYTMATAEGFLPAPFTVDPRVVLFANDKLFFCDLWPALNQPFEHSKRCYMVMKNPNLIIRDLGPMISQIVTYLPSKQSILGIDHGEQSLVFSPDEGKTWQGINRDYYRTMILASSDMINATVVPWITVDGEFDDTTTGEKCTAYSDANWHVCFKGIYYQNELVVDWTTPCPQFNPFVNRN